VAHSTVADDDESGVDMTVERTPTNSPWRGVVGNFVYELTEVPMVPLFIFFALWFGLGILVGAAIWS